MRISRTPVPTDLIGFQLVGFRPAVPEPVELMQCPDHDMPWKFSDSLLGVAQESYVFHLELYEIMYIETTSM